MKVPVSDSFPKLNENVLFQKRHYRPADQIGPSRDVSFVGRVQITYYALRKYRER